MRLRTKPFSITTDIEQRWPWEVNQKLLAEAFQFFPLSRFLFIISGVPCTRDLDWQRQLLDVQHLGQKEYRRSIMVSSSFAIFLVALNFSLSVTTFLGNVLILFALRKVNSIRPQTKLLFQCLAVTDLAVGLAVQPLLAIAFIPGVVKRNIILYLYQVSVSMGFFLLTVSVLTEKKHKENFRNEIVKKVDYSLMELSYSSKT